MLCGAAAYNIKFDSKWCSKYPVKGPSYQTYLFIWVVLLNLLVLIMVKLLESDNGITQNQISWYGITRKQMPWDKCVTFSIDNAAVNMGKRENKLKVGYWWKTLMCTLLTVLAIWHIMQHVKDDISFLELLVQRVNTN